MVYKRFCCYLFMLLLSLCGSKVSEKSTGTILFNLLHNLHFRLKKLTKNMLKNEIGIRFGQIFIRFQKLKYLKKNRTVGPPESIVSKSGSKVQTTTIKC